MSPETAQQVPAVFCGPTADAAFFVALALAVCGIYNVVKLLKARGTRTAIEDPR